jgi:NAD(P)H-hydrate epimerase
MRIFDTKQTRAWDRYTIENEPITPVDLMDRAAAAFSDWFTGIYTDQQRPVVILAGTGNNGGDGVAVARLLHWQMYDVQLLVCDFNGKRSPEFEAQLAMLPAGLVPRFLNNPDDLHILDDFNDLNDPNPPNPPNAPVFIDALFGSGLSRPLTGPWAQVADRLNDPRGRHEVASIDIPSGMFADSHTEGDAVVIADYTFSFETPKLAFFFPENEPLLGDWSYGSIGLHPEFDGETPFFYMTIAEAARMVKRREKFSHKGSYGHSLLVAGSFGTTGAAILAARACLRSGTGLLSVHAPRCACIPLQTAVPEAMYSADRKARFWAKAPALERYSAVGVGCGIGQESETAAALEHLLQLAQEEHLARTWSEWGLVLDADALNLLAQNPGWWKNIPPETILTPHPKEFERLFGKSANDFSRNELQRQKAQEHQVYIVLKGAHTAIACPDGSCWFNSTGNPGMATGGSGDVLTGILTGLLAQGYSPGDAALLGVFLHGLAGDLAAKNLGYQAMIAGDLTEFLGAAWQEIENYAH